MGFTDLLDKLNDTPNAHTEERQLDEKVEEARPRPNGTEEQNSNSGDDGVIHKDDGDTYFINVNAKKRRAFRLAFLR